MVTEHLQAGGQQALPESFFFSVRLDHERPRSAPAALDAAAKAAEGRRLRHMYQVGLLGFIREQNAQASGGKGHGEQRKHEQP